MKSLKFFCIKITMVLVTGTMKINIKKVHICKSLIWESPWSKDQWLLRLWRNHANPTAFHNNAEWLFWATNSDLYRVVPRGEISQTTLLCLSNDVDNWQQLTAQKKNPDWSVTQLVQQHKGRCMKYKQKRVRGCGFSATCETAQLSKRDKLSDSVSRYMWGQSRPSGTGCSDESSQLCLCQEFISTETVFFFS